jgi:hypothetical protein
MLKRSFIEMKMAIIQHMKNSLNWGSKLKHLTHQIRIQTITAKVEDRHQEGRVGIAPQDNY